MSTDPNDIFNKLMALGAPNTVSVPKRSEGSDRSSILPVTWTKKTGRRAHSNGAMI
jgi:hypothetical protein